MSECVEWPGRMRKGYPSVWRHGYWRSVLRQVYDGEVPPGWHVYQTCGNRRCIEHLSVRTYLTPGWNRK